ncbi:MAG: hypothetical protein WB588_08960 [Dehalococcoidia bacterium]
MKEDKSRLIGSLEIVTGVGILLFWIAFITVGMAPENAGPAYFAYEYSFIGADLVLIVMLIVAGILLMRRKRLGIVLSMAAAGALVYLGLVDITYNFRNAVYLASSVDLVVNAVLNLWCVGFGIAIIVISRKFDY